MGIARRPAVPGRPGGPAPAARGRPPDPRRVDCSKTCGAILSGLEFTARRQGEAGNTLAVHCAPSHHLRIVGFIGSAYQPGTMPCGALPYGGSGSEGDGAIAATMIAARTGTKRAMANQAPKLRPFRCAARAMSLQIHTYSTIKIKIPMTIRMSSPELDEVLDFEAANNATATGRLYRCRPRPCLATRDAQHLRVAIQPMGSCKSPVAKPSGTLRSMAPVRSVRRSLTRQCPA